MRGCLLAVLLCMLLSSTARAEPFELATLGDQSSLTPYVRWLRDDSGTASLSDVRAAYEAGRFQPVAEPVPQFGFTHAVHWLAFSVVDRVGSTPWILRLSYPLIDHVTLYRVLPNGTLQEVETGDMLPFQTRARPSLDFTFEERGTHAPTQYFVRAQTSGSLRLPLSAWRRRALTSVERRDELIAFAFLGAIAVLAVFNLGVSLVTRQLEHAVFAGVGTAELLALSSFGGLMAPLLPNHPALANRVLPLSLASCMSIGCAFAVVVLGRLPELARETRWVRRFVLPTLMVTALTLILPLGLALRTAVGALVLVAIAGSYMIVVLQRKRVPGVELHTRGWLCLMIALAVQLTSSALMLPSSFVTEWGSHIGCLLQGIVLSLALAQQLNLIKERLASNVSELEQALTQAERATRVKDEFVATMSHELRTPLNAIINIPLALLEKFTVVPGAECGACGDRFLLDEGESLTATCPSCGEPQLTAQPVTQFVGDPAQAKHFLALAERCGKHLLQMVNGVLDYSKIAAGKFELQLAPTDPVRLLREAAESMHEAAAQKGVALRLDLPFEPPQLATLDELRIRQVVFNLLSNAIKFSSAGGAIVVRAEDREHELEIAVRDEGIGIAREHQERIFGGFEQVHSGDNRKYGGSGLGLSISRSLVRMHGGELTVESELGKGATFRIRLPRTPAVSVANDNVALRSA